MTEAATKTRITSVGNVGVPTTDQDRALDFYVGKLGFEKRRDVTFGPGLRWVEVAPPGATSTVALLPTPPGSPVGVDTAIRLLTADAEADNASLLANGVDTDPVLRFGEDVPPMFTFRDPDGNTLYVVES